VRITLVSLKCYAAHAVIGDLSNNVLSLLG